MGTILRAKFNVTSYDEWKKVFDADPAGRAANGVTAYAILQASDDPNLVAVDLKFEDAAKAQAFQQKISGVVSNEGKSAVKDFKTRIFNKVEYKELVPKTAAAGGGK